MRSALNGAECTTLSQCVITKTELDGFGRPTRTFNPVKGSSPSVCSATTPCRLFSYDDLGRIVTETLPDGETETYSYSLVVGDSSPSRVRTAKSDPAGHKREHDVDGFGHLRAVREQLNETSASLTEYSYDILGNLSQVSQGSQVRTFQYDSLARLVAASNPEWAKKDSSEPGKRSFVYDANGNLTQKKAADGSVLVQNSYDALNRVTYKAYPGSSLPAVSFEYDTDRRRSGDGTTNYPKGHLTQVRVGGAQDNVFTNNRFSKLGRVREATQRIGTTEYPTSYSYDYAGNRTSVWYPGRSLTYTYDSSGRPASVLDGVTGTQYGAVQEYHAHGAPKKIVLGNGLVELSTYNERLQLGKIQLGTAAAPESRWSTELSYTGEACGVSQSWARNDGNVIRQSIKIDGATTFTQRYRYDALDRLVCADEKVGSVVKWGQEFGYDNFGNRWLSSNTLPYSDPLTPTQQSDFNALTNRVVGGPSGGRYDSDGNLERLAGGSGMSGHDLTYDREGRLVTSNKFGTMVSFAYDGLGRRILERRDSGETHYLHSVSGELLAEYGSAGGTERAYVTGDGLGSTRVLTGRDGQNNGVVSRFDYAPFGEALWAGVGDRTGAQGYMARESVLTAAPRQKFTGKERDAETGLDFFNVRYMSSAQGRFTSPDALPGWQGDPQSWNMYN